MNNTDTRTVNVRKINTGDVLDLGEVGRYIGFSGHVTVTEATPTWNIVPAVRVRLAGLNDDGLIIEDEIVLDAVVSLQRVPPRCEECGDHVDAWGDMCFMCDPNTTDAERRAVANFRD